MKLGKRKFEEGNGPRPPRQGRRLPGGTMVSGKAAKGGHFVLIIGDDGAILVFMQGSTVVRRLFAPSPRPDHTASMVELMQSNPGVPISVLADVIDQQYVRHSFPPVSSFSVNNLVKRRMERDFQAEDLTGMLRLGRDKAGRREWNYLLIALANTPLIQQWMELIVELPNELKGIYLTPLEAQNYIPALKKAASMNTALPWQLLITHNKVSGFRQVVLREGKLVFTRVTQAIDDGVAAVIAGNIEQEIISTLEYLRRLGFQDNESLELIVIAAQEVKESLDLNRFRVGAAQMLTPLDVADMLDLQQAALSADRFGDVVMASWFATAKKRALKFNTAYGTKLAQFYSATRGLKIVGALLVAGLVCASLLNIKDTILISSDASDIEQQRVPQRAEMTKLQKSLDSLDEDVAFKSAVVTVNDAFLKNAPSPLDFISKLALHLNSTFRVKAVTWAATAPAATTPGQGGMGGVANPNAASPLDVKVVVDIYGQFQDVEALSNATDTFIDGLRSLMGDYTITAEPYSWIKGSNNSMEISFDQKASETADTKGDRSITLTFKPKDKKPAGGPADMGMGVGSVPPGLEGM